MIKKSIIFSILLMSLTMPLQAGPVVRKPSLIREIKPSLSVTSPAPGQTRWHACTGKTANINWKYIGDIGRTINIILKGSSGGNITINSVPAGENLQGSYVWHIPENVSDGGKGAGGMFTVTVQAENAGITATGGKIEVLDPARGPCPDK
jgi:hypothetical protein